LPGDSFFSSENVAEDSARPSHLSHKYKQLRDVTFSNAAMSLKKKDLMSQRAKEASIFEPDKF
jgi:IS4 transposase